MKSVLRTGHDPAITQVRRGMVDAILIVMGLWVILGVVFLSL